MELQEVIINKIKSEGSISFHDFMNMCLYYPTRGYYMSDRNKVGYCGDYYTSVTVSPVFGELIAKQIEEMWRLMGEDEFTIVEYGAGTGELCCAILNYLKLNKKLFERLKYCIIEKSPIMRKKSYVHEKITWHNSIENISGVVGCILSNELVDNFAVHRVIKKEKLMEVFVSYNKNGFTEVLKPAGEELNDYLKELKVELSDGYKTEINLNAIAWIKELALNLKKGYVLTIDYGHPSFEMYNEHRNKGTMNCYYKHSINENPYNNIGLQDITTHVNFSALCLWGYKNGLDYTGYTDQCRFLTALGFCNHLKKNEVPGQDYFNFKKELFLTQTLIKEMGTKFKVLIQQKNMPKYKLSGLKNSL
ncbi:MAG: SAM-dependent methyltransferase [Bacteroidota bacterium]|nr:SAM-dependent methyltransferase [Bacteroidota bacterium]